MILSKNVISFFSIIFLILESNMEIISYQQFLEENWSGNVKTKVHPPKDLFANGTAKDITDWLKSVHENKSGAIEALNFYVNRAGNNLSSERMGVMNDVRNELEK